MSAEAVAAVAPATAPAHLPPVPAPAAAPSPVPLAPAAVPTLPTERYRDDPMKNPEWDAVVRLREIQVIREPGQPPLVGCLAVKGFLEVDDEGVLAVEAIREHRTLRAAHAALVERHGLNLDLVDFLRHLIEKGFVESVNGRDVTTAVTRKRERTFLPRVRPGSVRFLRSWWFAGGCGALVASAVAACFADPSLVPGYADVRLFPRASLTVIVAFLFVLANAFVHEMAHLLMARSFGLDASISVSHRFHFIVLQTDVTNAWTLPRRRDRCWVFLAGMAYNIVSWAVCVLLVALAQAGILPLGTDATRALTFAAFLNTIPIQFQFLVWLRTDLYFALLTVFRQRALLEDSRRYLGFLGRRAGLALMRYPKVPCAGCGQEHRLGERWCPRCGRYDRDPGDRQMPISGRARPLLLAFGVLLVLVIPGFLLFALNGLLRAFSLLFGVTLVDLRRHAGDGQWLLVAEDAVVGAVLSLQAVMLLTFALPNLLRRVAGAFEGFPYVWAWAALLGSRLRS
jgi:putative peptide zinc metalloprotease protein